VREQEQGDACRSQEDGGLHARRRAQTTGLCARRATWRHCGSVKTCLGIQNIRIIRCAGCQVPQMTGWATEATPEAPIGLFRDWQRTQTQSSVRTLWSLGQQMDVRFCREQEPKAERQRCATADSEQTDSALSEARRKILCFSLDNDLHGCPSSRRDHREPEHLRS